MKTNLYSKQNYNPIPLHKEHNSALSKNTNQTQPLKEKVGGFPNLFVDVLLGMVAVRKLSLKEASKRARLSLA